MVQLDCLDYSIYFGIDSYEALNEYLEVHEKTLSTIFILTDENTNDKCLPVLLSNSALADVEIIEIEPGEAHKNIETCVQLWETLSELGADRNSLLINLGGGVITDMGGFVASTFKRGIKYINVPTTLLSQVDASVGGKTGIDLGNLKNQVGVFSYPEMILIDTQYLNTLDNRQLKSGFAEMLKHGLIQDELHWETLIYSYEGLDFDQLENLIYDSVCIKKKVVEADPKENGLRKILNFGHTIGHAVESTLLGTPDEITHGEAVIFGMITEAYLAHKISGLAESDMQLIKSELFNIYKKIDPEKIDFKTVLHYMGHDKKNLKGEVKFALLSAIGTCEYDCKASIQLIQESFEFYNT